MGERSEPRENALARGRGKESLQRSLINFYFHPGKPRHSAKRENCHRKRAADLKNDNRLSSLDSRGRVELFLAKRGAECRAARFIISSRAKRACITQASQGQRDFPLAINLSSLVGVRLDVIQSSDVKAHYGFPGNRLPSTTRLWVLFMKTGFFHL